jgi:hypothetical protein
MAIDEALLRQARDRLGEVDTAARQLVTARAASRDAVRALHAGGASLREIAAALSLSHQRVHQLVGTRSVNGPAFECSFCGADQLEREKLVMGPERVGICERCAEAASVLLERFDADPHGTHRRLDPAMKVIAKGEACSFCAKKAPRHVPAVVLSLSRTAICGECLALCHEIYEEGPDTPG